MLTCTTKRHICFIRVLALAHNSKFKSESIGLALSRGWLSLSGAMRGLIRQQVQKGGGVLFPFDFAFVAANLKLSRFLTPKMRPNYPLLQREGGEAASFRAWANSRMDRRTSEVIGEGWN